MTNRIEIEMAAGKIVAVNKRTGARTVSDYNLDFSMGENYLRAATRAAGKPVTLVGSWYAFAF